MFVKGFCQNILHFMCEFCIKFAAKFCPAARAQMFVLPRRIRRRQRFLSAVVCCQNFAAANTAPFTIYVRSSACVIWLFQCLAFFLLIFPLSSKKSFHYAFQYLNQTSLDAKRQPPQKRKSYRFAAVFYQIFFCHFFTALIHKYYSINKLCQFL